MNARRWIHGLLPLAAIVLLAACSQGPTGSTISFTFLHDQQAYAVLQDGNGGVISTKSLPPGTTDVTFSNVPAGALITAIATETVNGVPAHHAVTAPASVVDGRVLYGTNTEKPITSSRGTISVTGTCPAGSSTSTKIDVASSARPWGVGGGGAIACDATGHFAISVNYYDVDDNGHAQLTFYAENGSSMTAFAHFTDLPPTQTSLVVGASDWQTGVVTDSSAVDFSPALATSETASVNLSEFAVANGLDVPLAPSQYVTAAPGASTVSLTHDVAPLAGASAFRTNLTFERSLCPSSGSCVTSWVRRNMASSTSPVDQTVTVGTDTWPTVQSVSWSANATTSPVVRYPSSPAFAHATFVQVNLSTTDSTTGTSTSWQLITTDSAAMSGTVRFPRVPSNLQSAIPVPGPSGNKADLWIADIPVGLWLVPFSQLPPSYNEVYAQSTENATTAGLAAQPVSFGTRGPTHGSGIWIR